MDKITRQCPQTTTFLKRKESRSGIEPRSFRLPAQRLTARPNRLTRDGCMVGFIFCRAHPKFRFPAPSPRRKDVVNQCLEFACRVVSEEVLTGTEIPGGGE